MMTVNEQDARPIEHDAKPVEQNDATRLSKAEVENFIRNIRYQKMGAKTLVGVATLQNGFEVTAHAACVDANNYDPKIGEELVYGRLLDKVWELLGFQLQSELAKTFPLK